MDLLKDMMLLLVNKMTMGPSGHMNPCPIPVNVRKSFFLLIFAGKLFP